MRRRKSSDGDAIVELSEEHRWCWWKINMSINTAHAHGGVLINAGECILLYCDFVEIKFGNVNDPRFKGVKRGKLYLTTHRMIFNSCDPMDAMQSFSFPFLNLSQVELEQPTFGCNYIRGKVKSLRPDMHMEPWEGCADFKIHFKNGGAIDYGLAMLEAVKLASRNSQLGYSPSYVPPMPPFHCAPPPMYTPPPDCYGLVLPTHTFPSAPNPTSVYMTDQPPPYPGVNSCPANFGQIDPPPVSYYPSCPRPPGGADAKAQEAAQSAYYDPNNPHYAYMSRVPPPYHNQPPPTYDEATKKAQ